VVPNVLTKEISENTHPTIQHPITEALNPLPALTSGSMSLNELSLQTICLHFPHNVQFYRIHSITSPAQLPSQTDIFIIMSIAGKPNTNVHLAA
jgi:hypothetical protein